MEENMLSQANSAVTVSECAAALLGFVWVPLLVISPPLLPCLLYLIISTDGLRQGSTCEGD